MSKNPRRNLPLSDILAAKVSSMTRPEVAALHAELVKRLPDFIDQATQAAKAAAKGGEKANNGN